MRTGVRKQVNALDVEAYFDRLAQRMKTNPPPPQDAAMVASMARIGLVPGRDFDPAKLGFVEKEALRMVPNPLNRYDLAQRDKLVVNADGSVDLHLQADSPGKDREANWLPAPKGKFTLVMRMYAPRKTPPSILDGSWTPPAVKPVP